MGFLFRKNKKEKQSSAEQKAAEQRTSEQITPIIGENAYPFIYSQPEPDKASQSKWDLDQDDGFMNEVYASPDMMGFGNKNFDNVPEAESDFDATEMRCVYAPPEMMGIRNKLQRKPK